MARFILILIVGLALLTWVASGLVQTTVREWFERDVDSRSKLVLTGARESLAEAGNNPEDINKQLTSLARDERVMGAAACGADMSARSSTPGFPQEFNCMAVGMRVDADSVIDSKSRKDANGEWSAIATLPTGRVYLSEMPITREEKHAAAMNVMSFSLSMSSLSS